MKTIIVGVGNPILSDDGIGVIIANQISALIDPEKREDVSITEASIGGIRLMELLVGFEKAIIIDAIQNTNGNQPGKWYKMSLADLQSISPTQHSTSPHDTSLITALELGQRLGFQLPTEITIYAIEVENIKDFGEVPSQSVQNSIPEVIQAIMHEIQREEIIAINKA